MMIHAAIAGGMVDVPQAFPVEDPPAWNLFILEYPIVRLVSNSAQMVSAIPNVSTVTVEVMFVGNLALQVQSPVMMCYAPHPAPPLSLKQLVIYTTSLAQPLNNSQWKR